MCQPTPYIRQWLLIGCLLSQLANCKQCDSNNPENNNSNNPASPFPITTAMVEEVTRIRIDNPGRGFELLEEVLKDLKDGDNATINKKGEDNMTALYLAAFLGRPHIVKALLERSADPNLQAADSSTPLHIALMRQRPDIALLLINSNKMSKANLEAAILGGQPGMTALAYARREEEKEGTNQADWQALIKALQAAGATK